MTNTTSLNTAIRYVISACVLLAAILAISIPSFASAALFAYVNQDGEVQTVTADTPDSAIMTAPNRAARSGVLLLNSADDSTVIGDNVSGV